MRSGGGSKSSSSGAVHSGGGGHGADGHTPRTLHHRTPPQAQGNRVPSRHSKHTRSPPASDFPRGGRGPLVSPQPRQPQPRQPPGNSGMLLTAASPTVHPTSNPRPATAQWGSHSAQATPVHSFIGPPPSRAHQYRSVQAHGGATRGDSGWSHRVPSPVRSVAPHSRPPRPQHAVPSHGAVGGVGRTSRVPTTVGVGGVGRTSSMPTTGGAVSVFGVPISLSGAPAHALEIEDVSGSERCTSISDATAPCPSIVYVHHTALRCLDP